MEITHRLTFNGVDLRTYGLYVSGDKTFDSPRKEYTKVSIPGRSGDLIQFNGRYSNVSLEYGAILIRDYDTNAAAIRSILMSPTDYCRLEDDYNPNEYRMAMFEGPLEFETLYLEAGSTNLVFDCQPQRWLKSGETATNIGSSNSITITNPTSFNAKPLFYINGRGKIVFTFTYADSTTASMTINIPSDKSGKYYIDCETMDCYTTTANLNNNPNSYLTVDEFPVLKPGATTIAFTKTSASISEFKVTPRWYIL